MSEFEETSQEVADHGTSVQFIVPTKKIFDERDLEEFKKSQACHDISNFVKKCSKAVVGISASDETIVVSDVISKFQTFMSRLLDIVDEVPPIQQPMRFGNKAFRQWHSRLLVETGPFLTDLLSGFECTGASIELAPYLNGAFGDPTRMDYGTGHELNVAIFFACLFKLRVIGEADLPAVVLRGFFSYIRVMRKLQTVYKLEPAGSHGVWGLDDYHCLTFLWGSSQLIHHPTILPSSIHDAEVLREEAENYLYLEGISFIKRIKCAAPFAETSPMLNDISGLPDWKKVMLGLIRLFEGEVLFKFPVVQHVLFGAIILCTWEIKSPSLASHMHHVAHVTASDVPFEATRAPWATTRHA